MKRKSKMALLKKYIFAQKISNKMRSQHFYFEKNKHSQGVHIICLKCFHMVTLPENWMHFPYYVHFLFTRSWKPVMCIESQYKTWHSVDIDLLLAFVAWNIHLTIYCISIKQQFEVYFQWTEKYTIIRMV